MSSEGDEGLAARLPTDVHVPARRAIPPLQTITAAIAQADPPPPLLINASAVGIYGDRGDEILTESVDPGQGFLAELAREWEEAALAAVSDDTRVVLLTGNGTPEIEAEARRRGVDAFLHKPLPLRELERVVAGLAGRAA